VSNATEVYRREILSQIPDGTYVWEDYAEHAGVEEPQLHRQRITLTMDSTQDAPPGLEFTGTRPRATCHSTPRRHAGEGPHQPLRRLRRRQLPQEVAGADPAQPGRDARADGAARRQRGRR